MRRLVGVATAGALLAAGLTSLAVTPARAVPIGASSGDGWSQTRTLTRDYFSNPMGSAQPATESRRVTVRVDKHLHLQDRERVTISWSGAHPSGGRAANPYGENGIDQEYPVVILECRGVDDPRAPASQRLDPSTCWTSTYGQRSLTQSDYSAMWRMDKYANADEQAAASGYPALAKDASKNPILPKGCNALAANWSAHYTAFRAADGTVYPGCNAGTMPPEAAVGASDPPNELAGFTGTNGSGSAQMEIRGAAENASLGCSHTVACTLVVVPIMGLSCGPQPPRTQPGTSQFNQLYAAWITCNATGRFDPGSSNFENRGPDPTVSAKFWWSPSNWRNRFSVPLGFALPPSTCSLLGLGQPVNFFGSELLNQAALQWAPAYCLRKDRFNWQQNAMPDDAAFSLLTSGQDAAAAEVSSAGDPAGQHIGYAPTALTGFGIAYNIDKPNNSGQFHNLRLNARLLAKLLSESYPGSTLAAQRPGLGSNPLSMNLDPEFKRLNPGLDTTHFSEAASTLLALSTSSAVTQTLTQYIASDPEAMSFLNGKPDPWGMRVNPAYKNISLPVSTWPLLDGWIPNQPPKSCLGSNPAAYLPKVAAPVTSLQLIATAMLLSWPNVQTLCDYDPTGGLWKLGRIPPQGIGSRFMLGLVSLGDAQRYGLDVASLQAAPGSYVAPTDSSILRAVTLARQADRPTGPFVIDQAAVRRSRSAYPGTMLVYTAAKLSGLTKAVARDVAMFIRISSTEGQVPGRGNGQLPAGYVPIRSSGATAPLYAQAQRMAAAVAAQKVPPTPAGPAGAPGGSGGAPGAAGGTAPIGVGGPGAGPGAGSPAGSPGGSGAATGPSGSKSPNGQLSASSTPLVKTSAVSTPAGSALLLTLVILGFGAALLAFAGQLRMHMARRR